jgi:tetratricopeptide (TPR) repeat protein
MAIKTVWLKLTTVELLACLFYLNSCTHVYHNRQAQDSIADNLASQIELSDTPFYPQTEHQCGPSALATVLQSHGVDVSPEALSSALYIPGRKGSFQVEISAASRSYGMLAYPLKPDFSDLLTEIAADNPVLVLQNLRFDWWPQWHYAVVIGYDIEKSELVLRSGTTKRWQTTFANFNKTWGRADNWALVIVPAGDIPATASASTYLKTVHDLEDTGFIHSALAAYRSATARWPDDANSWLTLGNMAYKAGDSADAVTALLKAAALSPENVIVWNNLAYALQAYGCPEQAQQALQCAYRYSPDDRNLRDSAYEISSMASQSRAVDCPQITCNQAAVQTNNRM